jgi:hypothetical protein
MAARRELTEALRAGEPLLGGDMALLEAGHGILFEAGLNKIGT